MRKRNNETPLKNLIYHTEQEVWKTMSPEHKGYRTALWNLLHDHMYSVGDYYVPADKLFFGTSVLADEILERLIEEYNFKEPKKILVVQPRYPYDDPKNPNQIVSVPEYLEQHQTEETFYHPSTSMIVVITEEVETFTVAIL